MHTHTRTFMYVYACIYLYYARIQGELLLLFVVMFVTWGIFYESGIVVVNRSIRWQQWKVLWVGIAVLPLPKNR